MGMHRKKHKVPTRTIAGFVVREVRPGYHCVDVQIDNRRRRRCFSDLDEAKFYCEQMRLELKNKGTAALSLSDALRADALAAVKILEPLNVSLAVAAAEYALRHPATATETFREACDRYLVDMRKAGRREQSIADKEGKLNRLCEGLGAMPAAAVDAREIEQWVERQGYTGRTAAAYAGAAKTILRSTKGENRRIQSSDEAPPTTWSAATVERIMRAAEGVAPDMVPALALLFFAGLRPDEAKRVEWSAIDLQTKEITLMGTITKTRTMRHVPMADNLVAWLEAYPGSGAVAPKGTRYRTQRERVMREAGLDGWPTDVPRHTFATALYRTTGDAAKVMAALGHFGDAGTFTRHYKGCPMTGAEAEAFWRITPTIPS